MLRDYQEINAQVPNLMEEASSLKDAVMAGDGETVRNTAAEIAGQVTDIHNRLESLPWKIASFVPVVGSDVSHRPHRRGRGRPSLPVRAHSRVRQPGQS